MPRPFVFIWGVTYYGPQRWALHAPSKRTRFYKDEASAMKEAMKRNVAYNEKRCATMP